jgi:hypothetical protein
MVLVFGADKKKLIAAFQNFENHLADLKDQAVGVAPPGSDTLKLIERRVWNLEQFAHDLRDAF